MLRIPKINLIGYIPEKNTTTQIELKEDTSKEMLNWPEFHNGAA